LPATTGSIGRKLTRLVLATTFAALFVAAVALVIYEAKTYREMWVADLTTQAEILARSSAPALAFEDPKSAAANLALLQAREPVEVAAIFRPNGALFALYSRPGVEGRVPMLPEWRGYRIEDGHLLLVHPIVENKERLGFVYLRARYELVTRIRDYLLILGAVMLASLVVALSLSSRLKRTVTNPIIALTGATRKVMDDRDFSARVTKTTDDEVGVLVDAFNAMLVEVGERSAAVEASNRSLQAETEERRAAESALRDADRRKDEFLATLAHELRNPLAPMVNAVAILRRAGMDPQVTERALAMMERQLAQMVRLVDDLLDVARVTTGKLTVRRQSTELAPVVRSAVETVRPLIDARKHELSVTLPPEPVFLHADATRLAQVFSNLLNNAAKYTEDGGRIALTASVAVGWLTVEVKDNGIGIAQDTLPRIFEMFGQVDQSLERKQSGLGVGLTLARRLVELHAGNIEVRSAGLGQGTTFIVRLPIAARPAAQHINGEEPVALAHDAKLKILLVDDNTDFAASLSILLQSLGHEVRVANDARAGLAVAREFAPNFAFLDIGLPEINGYQLAAQIRALPGASGIKLVAVSGWGQLKDLLRSQEAGFALHLVKPIELDQIRTVLNGLSSGRA
jgi:signal transduction histidine kinase/ActR/RegA family two-component response regulator